MEEDTAVAGESHDGGQCQRRHLACVLQLRGGVGQNLVGFCRVQLPADMARLDQFQALYICRSLFPKLQFQALGKEVAIMVFNGLAILFVASSIVFAIGRELEGASISIPQ